MNNLNKEATVQVLNKIYQYELAGVVRYTHYALMITGNLSQTFFNANESFSNVDILDIRHLRYQKLKKLTNMIQLIY